MNLIGNGTRFEAQSRCSPGSSLGSRSRDEETGRCPGKFRFFREVVYPLLLFFVFFELDRNDQTHSWLDYSFE